MEDNLTGAAEDLVNVSRANLSIGHKGIKTSLTADAAALHAPEGGNWSTHDSQGGGDELRRAHRVNLRVEDA